MMMIIAMRGGLCAQSACLWQKHACLRSDRRTRAGVLLGLWMCRQIGIKHIYGQRKHWPILTLRGTSGATSMVNTTVAC